VDIENEGVCVDCGDIVEFDIGDSGKNVDVVVEFAIGEVETDGDVVGEFDTETTEGVEIDVFEAGNGRISKISTTSEYPLELFCPPPKNILFVDDVDAR
jgi:hypothetical protein